MANTYTQCYFHFVFAVKNREALIKKVWKDELEMYITGIEKTTHTLILQTSDWNHQNTIITTIGILTSGYDH